MINEPMQQKCILRSFVELFRGVSIRIGQIQYKHFRWIAKK